MSRILVISPHPDDEAIGCGGTLCKHVHQGDQVQVLFLTSGEQGGHGRPAPLTRRLREAEARRAARLLGFKRVEFWHEPDGAIRATTSVIQRLRRKLNQYRPERIYVTHNREMHPDHRASARLVQRALSGWKPAARTNGRPSVLMYEVWTPLQQLDEIVDITPYVKKKQAAIRAYRTQCEVVGFDDAMLGLNRYRGEMHCWPEGDYAEVFALLKT